jgi:putative sterol carrier protein
MAAEQVFKLIGQGLTADPSLSSKINGVFLFKIGDKEWTVDLKSTPGKVSSGKQGTPDVTLTVAEPDFVTLMTGKATGQSLFMGGKLKV